VAAVRSPVGPAAEPGFRRRAGAGGGGALHKRPRAQRRRRPPFYGARARRACPGSGGAMACLAGGPGGRAGAGWVGPRSWPNPVDRFSFFRIYF
jgi:hypothetical protein